MRERDREREWGSHRKWRTAIGYMKIYLLHVTRPNVDKISKKNWLKMILHLSCT